MILFMYVYLVNRRCEILIVFLYSRTLSLWIFVAHLTLQYHGQGILHNIIVCTSFLVKLLPICDWFYFSGNIFTLSSVSWLILNRQSDTSNEYFFFLLSFCFGWFFLGFFRYYVGIKSSIINTIPAVLFLVYLMGDLFVDH